MNIALTITISLQYCYAQNCCYKSFEGPCNKFDIRFVVKKCALFKIYVDSEMGGEQNTCAKNDKKLKI